MKNLITAGQYGFSEEETTMEQLIISDYNPQWIAEYEQEKQTLATQLRDIIVGIEHIGSTAVPGLAAKPLIDIMLGVKDLQDITALHKERLSSNGYEFVDHPHFPERIFFRKGQWRAGTHHVHIYKYKSENWDTNLLFRDYLINHPDVMAEYNKLKKHLEPLHRHDRVGYTKAKAPFIETIIRKAQGEARLL
jgi:GrpB-like predicted nucleotidyltransferase (UPF0157 family)